ncbi:MAG: hypothetical protein AAGG09_06890 [Pseudomonadota bacterium]
MDNGTASQPAGAETTAGAPALLAAGLAAFVAALALRLTGIDSRDLWLDEIYTQFAASRDWLGLVDDRVSRGHSPFYFAILKLTGIDPANVTAVRGLSAVFDAGAAGVLAAGTLRYFGARAALFVAVLYVLSPLHIHWAQNARPYGLLMLFTAMGLIGAIGLLDTVGKDRPDGDPALRWPRLLFTIGWSGAALTMTGGILAYLVVLCLPWWPGLRRSHLSDPSFRRRWVRAQKIPSWTAFVTFVLVSRLHVADRIGNYWLETRRPFGPEALGLLLQEVGAGDVEQAVDAFPALWPDVALLLSAATVFAVLLAAIRAVTRPALRPATFALLALGFGLLAVMLFMSLNTSLLTGRYFTPAWLALLVAAGVGLATLRPVASVGLGAALVAVMIPLALGAAHSEVGRRSAQPQQIAALIDADANRHAPIVIFRPVFRNVRMELMLLRLDEPALPRPDMHGERGGERVERFFASGAPFFLALPETIWSQTYAADYAAEACLAEIEAWVIARFFAGPCEPPFSAP